MLYYFPCNTIKEKAHKIWCVFPFPLSSTLFLQSLTSEQDIYSSYLICWSLVIRSHPLICFSVPLSVVVCVVCSVYFSSIFTFHICFHCYCLHKSCPYQNWSVRLHALPFDYFISVWQSDICENVVPPCLFVTVLSWFSSHLSGHRSIFVFLAFI